MTIADSGRGRCRSRLSYVSSRVSREWGEAGCGGGGPSYGIRREENEGVVQSLWPTYLGGRILFVGHSY